MIKLIEIISKIIQESKEVELNEYEGILFEESKLFQELANPDFYYNYKEVKPDIWEFQDKYGNIIDVEFLFSSKYFESYFKAKDLKGNEIKIYDYASNFNRIQPDSIQGGPDEHRSDTICKILRDEIIPKYLLSKKPSVIKMHPLNEYRFNIFIKCAEICKEKYPKIEIKTIGKEIFLLYK